MSRHSERERASKDEIKQKDQYDDRSSYELYIQSVTCISLPPPRVTNRRSNRKTSLVTVTVDSERTKLSQKKTASSRIQVEALDLRDCDRVILFLLDAA